MRGELNFFFFISIHVLAVSQMIHTHTNTNTNIVKSDPAFCKPGPFVLLFSKSVCIYVVIREKFNINEKKTGSEGCKSLA